MDTARGAGEALWRERDTEWEGTRHQENLGLPCFPSTLDFGVSADRCPYPDPHICYPCYTKLFGTGPRKKKNEEVVGGGKGEVGRGGREEKEGETGPHQVHDCSDM